ncbi:MAG: hypothetical protein HQ402_03480 [Parcubacteria group bacterium]|nr:hypothetical protein [Parcubacteria group bacterium]
MKKTVKFIVGVGVMALPALAFAAGSSNLQGLNDLAGGVASIVRTLIPVAFGLELLYFFYGVAKFILSAGDEEKKGEGKQIMLWGVVALFVTGSLYGIISYLQGVFGITDNTSSSVTIPNI